MNFEQRMQQQAQLEYARWRGFTERTGRWKNDKFQEDKQDEMQTKSQIGQSFLDEFSRWHNDRRQVTKKAFIYLHKYLLARDIEILQLDRKKAREYARSLSFKSYLPQKLGLRKSITEQYGEWFLVYFGEHNQKEREEVLEAACNLYELVANEGGRMLKVVRGFQLCHLKVLLWVALQRIGRNDHYAVKKVLESEILQFIQRNRIYQSSLQEIRLLLKSQLKAKTTPTPSQLQKIFQKIYTQIPTNDLIPLMVGYLKVFQEKRDESLQVCGEFVERLKRENVLSNQSFARYLEEIRSHAEIRKEFVGWFRRLGEN